MATIVPEPRLRFDSDAIKAVQLFDPAGLLPGAGGPRKARRPSGARRRHSIVCVAVLLGAVSLSSGRAQEQNPAATVDGTLQQHGGAAPPGAAGAAGSQDPFAHHVEERMAERRNSERQKMLVADTQRLLLLAMQLKADVDKSTKDQLSIDVVKRAEQIEKLARSVKEKMRGN